MGGGIPFRTALRERLKIIDVSNDQVGGNLSHTVATTLKGRCCYFAVITSFNLFAPEPPGTACADLYPFYCL